MRQLSLPSRRPLPATPASDRLAAENVELVFQQARLLATRLPQCADQDAMVSDGMLGLLEASRRYRPDRGVKFWTYASRRVRGAMLDGLRLREGRPRGAIRRPRSVSFDSHSEGRRPGKPMRLGETLVCPRQRPDAAAELSDAAEAVLDRLLPYPAMRRVAQGRLEGRINAEIGAELGMCETRVCGLLHRARDIVRARLPEVETCR